jgi:hypothetical protein
MNDEYFSSGKELTRLWDNAKAWTEYAAALIRTSGTAIDFNVGKPTDFYIETQDVWLVPDIEHRGCGDVLNVGEPCRCLWCEGRASAPWLYRHRADPPWNRMESDHSFQPQAE